MAKEQQERYLHLSEGGRVSGYTMEGFQEVAVGRVAQPLPNVEISLPGPGAPRHASDPVLESVALCDLGLTLIQAP